MSSKYTNFQTFRLDWTVIVESTFYFYFYAFLHKPKKANITNVLSPRKCSVIKYKALWDIEKKYYKLIWLAEKDSSEPKTKKETSISSILPQHSLSVQGRQAITRRQFYSAEFIPPIYPVCMYVVVVVVVINMVFP